MIIVHIENYIYIILISKTSTIGLKHLPHIDYRMGDRST